MAGPFDGCAAVVVVVFDSFLGCAVVFAGALVAAGETGFVVVAFVLVVVFVVIVVVPLAAVLEVFGDALVTPLRAAFSFGLAAAVVLEGAAVVLEGAAVVVLATVGVVLVGAVVVVFAFAGAAAPPVVGATFVASSSFLELGRLEDRLLASLERCATNRA